MYTRGGDRGETGLFGAKRAPKDSVRIEAYGTIDELNSGIGLATSICKRAEIADQLKWIQNRLFVAGGDLATHMPNAPGADRVPRIRKEDIILIEGSIDELQKKLPRLTNFILPGGSPVSAHLHLARAVCRRAERRVVSLSKAETINPEMVPFLNRLSTYLFNLARYANSLEGIPDEPWEK